MHPESLLRWPHTPPNPWDMVSYEERLEQAKSYWSYATDFAATTAPMLLSEGFGYARGKLPRTDDFSPKSIYFGFYSNGARSGYQLGFDQDNAMATTLGLGLAVGIPTGKHLAAVGRENVFGHLLQISRVQPVSEARLAQNASYRQYQDVYHNVVKPKIGWTQLDFSCIGFVKGEPRRNDYTFVMFLPPNAEQPVISATSQNAYVPLALVEQCFPGVFGSDADATARRPAADKLHLTLYHSEPPQEADMYYPMAI